MKMGPREAALLIREKVHTTTMDPRSQHQVRYVEAVCQYAGIDSNPQNLQHVFDVLRENDIEIPSGDEYPKYIGKMGDRDLIADNEEHEQKLRDELEGKPVDNDGIIRSESDEDLDGDGDIDEGDDPAHPNVPKPIGDNPNVEITDPKVDLADKTVGGSPVHDNAVTDDVPPATKFDKKPK